MRKIKYTEKFEGEVAKFPQEVRENLFQLIKRFLQGERLTTKYFKAFKLEKNVKIQEFKIKDHSGNWRAISCFEEGEYITFVYAFHKKSQRLLEKDKKVIVRRIKEIGHAK